MSLVLTCAGYTAAHLESHGDQSRGAKVIGANRETPVKYLKGIKQCSSKKVTQLTVHLRSLYTSAFTMATDRS